MIIIKYEDIVSLISIVLIVKLIRLQKLSLIELHKIIFLVQDNSFGPNSWL